MNTQKILISACLLGEQVRYDGRSNLINSPLVNQLQSEGRLVPLCPELLGGLPVPRSHASIEQRFPIKVITTDQQDVTPEFVAGAEAALELAKKHQCVAALLKADSPSCGNNFISSTTFSGRASSGPGVAAQELIQGGIPVFNEHQIDKLEMLLLQRDADYQQQSARDCCGMSLVAPRPGP